MMKKQIGGSKKKNTTKKDRLAKQALDVSKKWLIAQRDNLLSHAKKSDDPEFYNEKAKRYERELNKLRR